MFAPQPYRSNIYPAKSYSSNTAGSAAAFTLIELLIVVAIIAILAAIAVPNFLEAQTRAKVTRVKSDMRSIATAIEAYYTDHNRYPEETDDTGPIAALNLYPLTTPVAFITSLEPMHDVFQSNANAYASDAGGGVVIDTGHSMFYVSYYNFGARRLAAAVNPPQLAAWGLSSLGPDRQDDGILWLPYLIHPDMDSQSHLLSDDIKSSPYDTTNGTMSSGDLMRTGGSGLNNLGEYYSE